MIRRINFLGGPGVGKSSVSAFLFSKLKRQGVEIELIQEYAKEWAYEKRDINEYDQLALFSTQLSREYRILKNSPTSLVICESPTILTIPYAKRYNFPCVESLWEIESMFEKEYPSINIFLKRNDCPYNEMGRYEDHKMAKRMDNLILDFLKKYLVVYFEIDYNDYDEVYNIVNGFIGDRK